MAVKALGPVLDDFEFDTVSGYTPIPIHLDGEYYAVIYRYNASNSWLKTYRITSLGAISEIDTWKFSTEDELWPRIYHISENLYAITYKLWDGNDNLGYLKTLHISVAGVITKSFDDTYEIPHQEYSGFLFHIFGSVYALIAGESPSAHLVYTFTIVTGAAGISFVDSYNYVSLGYHVEAAGQIGSNIIFSLFSCDVLFHIYTFHISDAGDITEPFRDDQDFAITLNHDLLNACKVGDNVYAVAMWDQDTDDVSIQTVKISYTGTIQATLVDSALFGTCTAAYPSLCNTGTPGLYFVVYPGADGHGFIDVIKIDTSGNISDHPLYSAFEFDAAQALYPQPLPMNGIWMPVFYTGSGGPGWLKTITFTLPPSLPHHEMIVGVGP